MARFDHNQTEKTYSDKPPHPLDPLLPIYRAWRRKGKSSAHLDHEYNRGIDDFVQLLEPRGATEQIQQETDKNGAVHWKDPYSTRLTSCFRIFLSATEEDRDFIVSNIRRGVAWRGDSIAFFRGVVDEHFKYLADPQGYIKENAARIEQAARGMVV